MGFLLKPVYAESEEYEPRNERPIFTAKHTEDTKEKRGGSSRTERRWDWGAEAGE